MTDDRSTEPRTPVEFGREVQRLRENAGLAIEDIARETKISLQILNGLEAGRFQTLPNVVFARNFVRQVADTVGCDDERLVNLFDKAWEHHKVTSGTNPVLTFEPSSSMPVIKTWVWIPLGSAVVIMIAVVLAVLLLRSRQASEGLSGNRWQNEGAAVARAEPTEAPRPSPVATAVPSPTPDRVHGAFATDVEVRVSVREGRECWIRSRDAGGRVTRQLLRGGESIVLSSKGRLELTVGDASAVVLGVGGRVYDELGRGGQVRHFEVTPEGIEALGAWRADGEEPE